MKNSSGLGFSFCREDSVSPEQPGSSIVRVKKLFPGQPAAESGQIEVGDVILKVNGSSLKGLSQQVSTFYLGLESVFHAFVVHSQIKRGLQRKKIVSPFSKCYPIRCRLVSDVAYE